MNKITATAGLVALGAASVQAQITTSPAGSQEATKPWSISAVLRGFYDDNYTTSPKHLELDSMGIEVSPSASVNLISDQTAIGLNYVYSMRWYEDREGQNDVDWSSIDHSHQFNGKLSHAFTPRFKFDLSDSFVIAQEPELVTPAGAGISASGFRSDGDVIRNHAQASLSAGITENLTAVLGYGNEFYDYDEEGFMNSRSASLDRMEHLASINLRAVVAPKTIVVGGYNYEIVDYHSDDRIGLTPALSFQAEERNSTSHYIYAGVDQGITPTLNLSVRGGAQLTQYDDLDDIERINPEVDDEIWSPYLDANVTWLYMPGSYAQLGARHQRAQTDLGFIQTAGGIIPNLDAQSTAVYGSVNHRFFGAFVASLIASYQHNEYDQDGFDSFGEDYFMAGLNLTYELNRFLALEAGYNYDWLDSDSDEGLDEEFRSYKRNRVYVGVRGTY